MSATTRVVVVEYDGEAVLPDCLASLVRTVPPDIPITVIDNASPTPAESLIPLDLKDRVEILRLQTNIGYAGAIAEAWSLGDEEFVVIANNDLEFTDGWLRAFIEAAERTGAHAVSATIEHDHSTPLESSTNASLNPLLYLIPGVFRDRTKAIYPSGACFLLRRDPGLGSRAVDPEYFLYYEDVYIGFLLRSLGKTIIQCPDARVRHRASHAVRKADPNRIAFLQERNRLLTQILFFSLTTLLGISPIILLDSLLKIPACWIRGKPAIPTLQAHFWVLLNIRRILRKRARLREIPGFDPKRILPWLTGRLLPPDLPTARFWNALSTGWFRLVGIPVDREARA